MDVLWPSIDQISDVVRDPRTRKSLTNALEGLMFLRIAITVVTVGAGYFLSKKMLNATNEFERDGWRDVHRVWFHRTALAPFLFYLWIITAILLTVWLSIRRT